MKRLNKFLLLALTTVALTNLQAQDPQADIKAHYKIAFDELNQMISGQKPASFKRAVFISENAYLGNQLSYDDFLKQISGLVSLTKAVAATDGLIYDKADKQQVLLAASIFRVMKDSLVFQNADTTLIYQKYPYRYDMNDFWGDKDWTKMFVTKLLDYQTGNCHSLPALYKILADEVGVNAWLSLAPNHTYIKQWCDKIGWYNTELTTGQFPFDHDIKANSYIKTETIAAGVFMDTLSSKETIAYVMTDLAQGYVKRFGHEDDFSTPLSWLNVALQYFPDYVNALILKAELEKKQLEHLMKDKSVQHLRSSKNNELKERLIQLDKSYNAIHLLGYRRMPKEMYLNWLFRVQNDTTRQPFKFETPQPFKKYNYDVQIATGGTGENSEFFDLDTVVRIGTVKLNTVNGRISEFVQYSEEEMPDEVISRMYDPALGRWWSQDQLADAYVDFSPYTYVLNNPLKFVDPDGQKVIYVNGHWQQGMLGNWIGSSRSAAMYWGEGFVREASRFFNDGQRGNGMFIDGSSQWGGDESGSQRYTRGYEYAKEHYEELIADMRKDETFKIVTHSEGGAFGAGIAAYLLEQGKTVETVVHLSPDEADEFETPEGPNTYQVNYGGDPVVGTTEVKGTDKSGVVDKFSKMMDKLQYSHGSTKGAGVWKEVRALLDAATKGATSVNVTETKSGVKFEIIRDNSKKKEEQK